jgi:hypothetical protein
MQSGRCVQSYTSVVESLRLGLIRTCRQIDRRKFAWVIQPRGVIMFIIVKKISYQEINSVWPQFGNAEWTLPSWYKSLATIWKSQTRGECSLLTKFGCPISYP